MCKLITLFALGLILAGCDTGPAPPTPLSALPATPTSQGAGSAFTSPVTATMVPPLVPAFPTSTVAFSGAGPSSGALPFRLDGGTYHVSWTTHPTGPGWNLPTWHLDVSIHDPDSSSNYHQLFSLSLPAAGAQNGSVVVHNIPAGTYVLDATAAATCAWAVSIQP